jgi:hypothetical protein
MSNSNASKALALQAFYLHILNENVSRPQALGFARIPARMPNTPGL